MEPEVQYVACAMARQAQAAKNRRQETAQWKDVAAAHVPDATRRLSPNRANRSQHTPPLRFVAFGVKTVRFRLGGHADFSYLP